MGRKTREGVGKGTAGTCLLDAGLALELGWCRDRYRRFVDAIDGQTEHWLDSGGAVGGEVDLGFLTDGQRKALGQLRRAGAEALRERVAEWPGQVIVCDEAAYPASLAELDRPPAALHVRGDVSLLCEPSVAVVGSRDVSVEAASAARRILDGAIGRGVVVVSGGALGSDAVAHRAAVEAGAPSAVVLPSGVENTAPKSNRGLFSRVIDCGGALVSEYPPRQGVRRYHFRRRNSLMAAMSRGVFVVRAGKKSGTMLTVRAARELNRPLAAMPGRPANPLTYGCHEIIRDGGDLIAGSDHFRTWWGRLAPERCAESETEEEAQSVAVVDIDDDLLEAAAELVESDGAFSLDALERKTGRSAAELQTALLERELSGLVERIPGCARYRLVESVRRSV